MYGLNWILNQTNFLNKIIGNTHYWLDIWSSVVLFFCLTVVLWLPLETNSEILIDKIVLFLGFPLKLQGRKIVGAKNETRLALSWEFLKLDERYWEFIIVFAYLSVYVWNFSLKKEKDLRNCRYLVSFQLLNLLTPSKPLAFTSQNKVRMLIKHSCLCCLPSHRNSNLLPKFDIQHPLHYSSAVVLD